MITGRIYVRWQHGLMSLIGYERKFQPLLGDFRFRAQSGHSWHKIHFANLMSAYRGEKYFAENFSPWDLSTDDGGGRVRPIALSPASPT